MDIVVSTVRGFKFIYDKFEELKISGLEITELRNNMTTTETILKSALRVYENVQKHKESGKCFFETELLQDEELASVIIEPATRLATKIEKVESFLDRMQKRNRLVMLKKAARTIIEINALHREISYAIQSLTSNLQAWEMSITISTTLDNIPEHPDIVKLRDKLKRYPEAISRKEGEIHTFKTINIKHVNRIESYLEAWDKTEESEDIVELREQIISNEIKIIEVENRLEELRDNEKICEEELNLRLH